MADAELAGQLVRTVSIVHGYALLPIADADVHQQQRDPQVLVGNRKCHLLMYIATSRSPAARAITSCCQRAKRQRYVLLLAYHWLLGLQLGYQLQLLTLDRF